MKQKLCILLAAVMIVLCITPGVSAAGIAESGTCGENASYTLYTDGRLVITGTGAVETDIFTWRTDITSVEFGEGITELGARLFECCSNIASFSLPSTLTVIGEGVFYGNESLTGELVIPDSVTEIGGGLGAFGKTGYSSVVIGQGVTVIPYGTFSDCRNLTQVTMPDHITCIGAYAFSFCPRLTYIEIPAAVTEIGPMAFVNDFSLGRVVFKGSAPAMDSPFYCSSFNTVAYYPAGDESWADDMILFYADLTSLLPYTIDDQGNMISGTPDESFVQQAMTVLRETRHPAGSAYPDSYNYIINGDFVTGYGSEAFAFQVSDALCGFMPLGEKQAVDASALNVGDILYMNGTCCTITAIDGDTLTVAGVENNAVYYDRTLTRAQASAAEALRARVGAPIVLGQVDPSVDFELTDLPTTMPTQEQVYDKILSLQDIYPEGMPYSSKNHFHSKTDTPTLGVGGDLAGVSMNGHGCSAYGFYISDLCFGNLPAYYYNQGQWNFEDLKVGDLLSGLGHMVVILEVHEDHIVITEGNYEETIHWFRTMTREECLESFALYTRYGDSVPEEPEEPEIPVEPPVEPEEPEIPVEPPVEPEEPKENPFNDVPEGVFYSEPVAWAVENGITTGASADTFNPNGECMRAHVVTFLWRAAGQPEPTSTENPFLDVKASDFFYKAVLWAVENNITNGVDATHFGPTVNCNRAQVVTFLYRAMGSPEVNTDESAFADVVQGQWYEQAVLWAVENAVTNGLSADTFGTTGICNRAQVVTFLYRTYVD